MQVPICCGWRLSVVLTKGKYSSCLNPHVLIFKHPTPIVIKCKSFLTVSYITHRRFGIEFKPRPIFDKDWDRLFEKFISRHEGPPVVKVFQIGPFKGPGLSCYKESKKYRLYLFSPWFKTKCWKF